MLTRPFREAVITLLATLATLACAWAIAPGSGSAVLAVVLCVSVSRTHLDRDRRGRIEAAIALPLVGLIAVALGGLLRPAPWCGTEAGGLRHFLFFILASFNSGAAGRAGIHFDSAVLSAA